MHLGPAPPPLSEIVTFEPGASVMTSPLGLLRLVTPGVGLDLALTRMLFPLVLTETLLLPDLMFTSPASSFSFSTPCLAPMRLVDGPARSRANDARTAIDLDR